MHVGEQRQARFGEQVDLSANGNGWVLDPDPFLYGSGGGFSPIFPRSSYQNGVGYGKWTHIDGWSESVVDYIRTLESTASIN